MTPVLFNSLSELTEATFMSCLIKASEYPVNRSSGYYHYEIRFRDAPAMVISVACYSASDDENAQSQPLPAKSFLEVQGSSRRQYIALADYVDKCKAIKRVGTFKHIVLILPVSLLVGSRGQRMV